MTAPPGVTAPGTARRDLAVLAAAGGVSQFGAMVTAIAVALHLRPFGPGTVALAMVAELAPIILAAPAAGVLVDRYSNRLLMVCAYAAQAVAVLGITVWIDHLPAVLALLAVVGTGTAVAAPAAAALVPRAVGEPASTRAFGHLATARTVGFLAGLAASGVLVGWGGTRGALLVNAATYAAQGLLVLTVAARRAPLREAAAAGSGPPVRSRRATTAELLEGWRALHAEPLARTAVVGLFLGILVTTVVNVASVFLIVEDLGAGPVAFGLVEACWGVGAAAGAWMAGRLGADAARLARAVLLGVAVMGTALLGVGTLVTMAATVAGWLVAGCANGVQNVALSALVRLVVPDRSRGRAFGAVGAVFTVANVSALLLGGPVVEVLGAPGTLVVSGALALVVGCLGVAAVARAAAPGARPGLDCAGAR